MSATDPRLDRFVLGCSQIGGLYQAVSDKEAMSMLETAWELGVRHFDTAPHYGVGLSEQRLGRFLRGLPRDEFTVSTKVGRLLVPSLQDVDGVDGFFGTPRMRRVLNYGAIGVRRSLEASLERLGLDRVDTLYVHDPAGKNLDIAIASGYPALHRLRAEGTIRHIGVGTNDIAPLFRFLEETDIDQAMLAGRYTLLDRSGTAVLDRCRERGIRVVAAGVFNSGLLAAPATNARFDYTEAPPELVARAREYAETAAVAGVSIRAAAIHFVLRHPAVSQVALGCRTAAQVRDNVSMLGTRVPVFWNTIHN